MDLAPAMATFLGLIMGIRRSSLDVSDTRQATMDLAPVMATFLGLIMSIGRSNLDLYQIQDSHHGPFPGFGYVPGPYNGHMAIRLGLM